MKLKNIIKSAALVVATFASLGVQSCVTEIEHGENSIDRWPVEPPIEVNYNPTLKHPGIIHTEADMVKMREIVANKVQPGYGSFVLLRDQTTASATYPMAGPYTTIGRGDNQKWLFDMTAAYYNALMYAITLDEAHAQKSAEILKAYASTLTSLGTTDNVLLVGIQGIKFIYAAEVIHSMCPAQLNDDDFAKVCKMLKDIFIPVLDNFYKTPPYTNGNWGACATMTYIAAAVLFDDKDMYKRAIDQYLYAKDNGTIRYYVDDSGQNQESGRDQAHAQLGLYGLAMTCEVAWKQGTDLYSVMNNRLCKGFEYTAKYNLGNDDVPYKVWTDLTGKYSNWTKISTERRGEFRQIYEVTYNHYAVRKKRDMPYTKSVLDRVRPEGVPHEDHLGFGSLIFSN